MEFLKNSMKTRNDLGLFALRIVLGLVMLPHALQKSLGMFGGGGIEGSLGFFASIGIPTFVGVLVILVENVGALALLTGFMGRLGAAGIAAVMVGAIAKVHIANGFFMNWFGNQAGEGFEYHLLVLAMCAAILIGGSGAFSLDGKMTASGD